MSYWRHARNALERGVIAALVWACALAGVHAQGLGSFLKIEGVGTSMYGESTRPGYENWIELQSYAALLRYDPTAEINHSFSFAQGDTVISIMGNISWTQTPGTTASAIQDLQSVDAIIPRITIEVAVDGPLGAVTLVRLTATDIALRGHFLNAPDTLVVVGYYKTLSTTLWSLDEGGLRAHVTTFTLDYATGSVTTGGIESLSSSTGFGPGNLAPVPEPNNWLLLLSGLAILGACKRRGGRR